MTPAALLALLPVALTGLVAFGVARFLQNKSWRFSGLFAAAVMALVYAFQLFGWITILVFWAGCAVWVIGVVIWRRRR